jgi:hypothetical protein
MVQSIPRKPVAILLVLKLYALMEPKILSPLSQMPAIGPNP